MKTEVKEVQSWKALASIVVTFSGIRTFCKERQHEKVPARSRRSDLGMFTLCKEQQPAKTSPSMEVILLGSVTAIREWQDLKAPGPSSVIPLGMFTSFKKLQSAKACSSMTVTPSGITIVVKDWQPLKQEPEIRVTPCGRLIFAKDLHFLKAPPSTSSTASGIWIWSKELQPEKATQPIAVKVSGRVTVTKDSQSTKANGRSSVNSLGILTCSSELHFAKAESPIKITESGIIKLFKVQHPMKAACLMLLTESGMLTSINALQSRKASVPMHVTVSGSWTETKDLQLSKAKLGISLVELGICTTSNDSSSQSASSWHVHSTGLILNTTCRATSSEMPASLTVSSSSTSISSSKIISTWVIKRVSSSEQTCKAFNCPFKSRIVVCGITSSITFSPFNWWTTTLIATELATHPEKQGIKTCFLNVTFRFREWYISLSPHFWCSKNCTCEPANIFLMLFLRCLSPVPNFTGDSLTPSCCLFIGRCAGLWLQLQMKALKCWTVQINESISNLKLVLPLITIESICRNINLSLITVHQKNSKSLLPLWTWRKCWKTILKLVKFVPNLTHQY